ncbi:MAG TPA: D-alanyl-D-alanine carboxypeptidase [Acidimicrobiales bacterium]|nr:D-alanyl-D-alanine carboxypeptidase [Acidimicrobiales bacterium]
MIWRKRLAFLAAGPTLASLLAASPAGSSPVLAAGTSRPAERPLATPILSARRLPAWVDDTLAGQRLAKQLGAVTAGRLGGAKGPPGCVEVAQGARTVWSLDPTAELIPASNLKVVTATAVLSTLGADDRLTTTVAAPAPARAGTLTGNLYLVGGGDPYLMTAAFNSRLYYPEPVYTSLDRLAAAVRVAGITTVTGSVVGDASRYDSLVGVPGWAPQYLAEGDVGPLSALEVDDGAQPVDPGTPSRPAGTRPPAADPALFAAQAFTYALRAQGVRVTGPPATGRTPAGSVTVTSAQSAPLGAEVEQLLRVSDDTAAELLTKELGFKASGHGTTAAGTAVISRDVAADGLPVAQLVARDGSGLDREDRATCALITATLQRAGTTGPVATGLPVAGRTGTLRDRMAGTVAVGRLHAKTGTLDGVSALSGYIDPKPGAPTPELAQPVYFSIIINGMDSDLAAPLADRIGVTVAAYPDAVPLAQLEPRS